MTSTTISHQGAIMIFLLHLSAALMASLCICEAEHNVGTMPEIIVLCFQDKYINLYIRGCMGITIESLNKSHREPPGLLCTGG